MPIPWTGVGGFFTRAGAITGEYNRVASLYGSTLDVGFQSIWSQFASSNQSAVQNLPDVVAAYRFSGQQYQQTLQFSGSFAAILQTQDYYSVVPATLQQSFVVIAAQMRANSQTIQRATLTSTATPWASNVGNAKFILSTVNQFGDPIDTTYAETITATCISAGTNYQETFQAIGRAQISSSSHLWPGGSGGNTSFAVSDPNTTGLISDGGFELWNGTGNNNPINWDIINGSAGVTIFRGTGGVRGNYTAVITSDGASLTALAQSFNAAINTVYAVSVQAKMGSASATGNFAMCITDGNGTILNDDAGNPLSYTRDLNGQIGTSFAIITAFFAMPRTLPLITRVQYGFGTVAAIAARTLTLDLAGIVQATQLYTGGPFVAAFAQATPNSVSDYYSLTFTNSLGSNSFAMGLQRMFNTPSLGVYFPSANSPTISDSLVTH